MKPGIETAAICGLFCGTCPSYPKGCGGCLSDNVAPGCDTCGSGFRDCANLHHVIRCHECREFPCARLKSFSKKHIVNGICHHAHIMDDLTKMQEICVEAWVESQTDAHTCKSCGQLIPWFEKICPRCEP